MSLLGSQRDGTPVVISPDGVSEPLERVSFADRSLQESFLQKILHGHPTVLPIERIEPEFAPLIPIWELSHELVAGSGYIDAMFVSPSGAITIAETKLWRNPEARREVVGQIINYATEVSGWRYEELDERVRHSTGISLWERVRSSPLASDDLDEARFVDAVSRSLARGRFLLLIVGDGIREDVERMADFLQGAPRLRFTLALVELRLHKLGPERTLVVPSVLARTTEITRAIVQVDGIGAKVNVTFDPKDPISVIERRRTAISEAEFFESLEQKTNKSEVTAFVKGIADQFRERPFYIDTGTATLIIRLADPQRKHDITVLGFTNYGTIWTSYLDYHLRSRGIEEDVRAGREFLEESARLLGRHLKEDTYGNLFWDREVRVIHAVPHSAELVGLLRKLSAKIGA